MVRRPVLWSVLAVWVVAAVGFVVDVVRDLDLAPVPGYGLEGAESQGGIWVKSCVSGDQLVEAELRRDGSVVWTYEAIGDGGVSLAEPVDVTGLDVDGSYRFTGDRPGGWQSGDQIVFRSAAGGYLSWGLSDGGASMSLEDLRALPCVGT